MVGKRGTDEAKHAAREARRKAARRKRYEELIEGHSAVKAMRSRVAPPRAPTPVKPGVPRLITEAMQDPDIAKAVPAIRRVARYERRADDLVQRRQKGERIPLNEQTALVRQGANVEADLQQVFRLTSAAARRHPATEAYAVAVASHLEDTEILDNPPAYLTRDEKAAMRYLGLEPDDLTKTWDREFKPHRQKAIQLLRSGELTKELQRIEKSADRIKYPKAPRHLVKQDILTLDSGIADWALVAIFGISGFCFCVLVFGICWLIWYAMETHRMELEALGQI